MTSDIRHDPLAELSAQGVAVWLDDLSRELLASGEAPVPDIAGYRRHRADGIRRARVPEARSTRAMALR